MRFRPKPVDSCKVLHFHLGDNLLGEARLRAKVMIKVQVLQYTIFKTNIAFRLCYHLNVFCDIHVDTTATV